MGLYGGGYPPEIGGYHLEFGGWGRAVPPKRPKRPRRRAPARSRLVPVGDLVEEPFDAGAVVDGVVPDEAELGRSPQLQGLADLPAEEPGGALEAGDQALLPSVVGVGFFGLSFDFGFAGAFTGAFG